MAMNATSLAVIATTLAYYTYTVSIVSIASNIVSTARNWIAQASGERGAFGSFLLLPSVKFSVIIPLHQFTQITSNPPLSSPM